ncbi:LOWER TEMPERATURE 1-like protein [Drosera capensis]
MEEEEGCLFPSASSTGNGGGGVGIGGGASKLLSNLPSRGLFSSTVTFSNLVGGMRVYISERDTSPPDHQVIETDQENILIRSLTIKRHKGDIKGETEGSRKRVPEKVVDGRASAKRVMTSTPNGAKQEASSSRVSDNLQGLTVERLRVLLREKGLSPKGKKASFFFGGGGGQVVSYFRFLQKLL